MARFHYFNLEEVYQYAEQLGYSREDVEIKEQYGYDWDADQQFLDGYEVSFGREYSEVWSWDFEDLNQPAVYYDHVVWED